MHDSSILHPNHRGARAVQAIAVLVLVISSAARAQEPGPTPPPVPPTPTPLGPVAPGGDATEKEMRDLFVKVEKRLREIDSLLFDAGAGKAPKEPVANAGIDQLLRNAAESGKTVKEDIDRILELARKRGQSQSSSGGGSSGDPKKSGTSPLDQQRDGSPSGRESTPTKPQEGKDKQGEQPGQDGQPKSPKKDDPNADPKNRSGGPPPRSPTDRSASPDSRDKWGDLPVHVREVFRVEGGADLPPQYRDWIDGYYRRLQQSERHQ